MWFVKVNGEVVGEKHNKVKAKAHANEIAREMFPSPEPASITAEDYRGVVHRSIYYDGWNVYTDHGKEK